MKKIVFILLFPLLCSSQNDTIFRIDDKVVPCTITLTNESAVFFKDKKGNGDECLNSKIKYYSLSGKRITPALPASAMIEQKNPTNPEIYFIGYGGNKKLYLNDRLITAFGDQEIVKYKMHSKGRISVTYSSPDMRHEGIIEIKDNKTYYYLGGNAVVNGTKVVNEAISKVIFEEFKENFTRRKNYDYKIIEIEEDIHNPVGETRSSEYEGSKQGTCFLVNKNGYLLTNHHVVKGAKTLQVKGIDNDFSTLYGADVVAYDIDLDLALLKLKSKNVTFEEPPYNLNAVTSPQGTRSFVLGYPLVTAMGEDIKVTEGIISAKSGFKGSISQYQFSAAVQPGNSGSPLFDDNGNVVGIINSKLSGAEGAGYAIKSQYISTFLKLIDAVKMDEEVKKPSSLSLTDRILTLKKFVFIVQAD